MRRAVCAQWPSAHSCQVAFTRAGPLCGTRPARLEVRKDRVPLSRSWTGLEEMGGPINQPPSHRHEHNEAQEGDTLLIPISDLQKGDSMYFFGFHTIAKRACSTSSLLRALLRRVNSIDGEGSSRQQSHSPVAENPAHDRWPDGEDNKVLVRFSLGQVRVFPS